MSNATLFESNLKSLKFLHRGKVRDIYAVGDDRVLLLTTDRISAFDVVMAETIPMKGAVLTQISAWWFRQLEGVVPHHMISADADAPVDRPKYACAAIVEHGGFGAGALRRRDVQRDQLLDAFERLALKANEDFEIGLVGAHELFSRDHGANSVFD